MTHSVVDASDAEFWNGLAQAEQFLRGGTTTRIPPYANDLFARLGVYDEANRRGINLDVNGAENVHPHFAGGRLVGNSGITDVYSAEYDATIKFEPQSTSALNAVKKQLLPRNFSEYNTRWHWEPTSLLADRGGDELIVRGIVTPVSVRTRYHPFRTIFSKERSSRRSSSSSRKSSRARATTASRKSTRASTKRGRKRK